MPLSTVSVVLKRQGLGRLGRIGLEQPHRYERERPGELVHIDIKKLARIKGGAGWRVRDRRQHYNATFIDLAGKRRRTVGYEYVHVAVDVDCPRFRGQRVVRRLVVLPRSSFRSRRVRGSRAWSAA
jgi:hypothetical protein